MNNIFEQASRRSLRFSYAGNNISAERLWQLGLPQLNAMYQELQVEQQKKGQVHSLLGDKQTSAVSDVDLKVAIVIHVFKTKQDEAQAVERQLANAATKQRILAIVEEKKHGALAEKSIEELLEIAQGL